MSMQLLEHAAKAILSEHGLPVPKGIFVRKKNELNTVTDFPCIAKSQVPVGGRGKAGGIKVVEAPEKLEAVFDDIMNLEIKGHLPSGVLFEQKVEMAQESYLAFQLNRDARSVEVIASPHGGVEIEESKTPPAIVPLDDSALESVAKTLGFEKTVLEPLFSDLRDFFFASDCLLLEINPLITTPSGELILADAKIMIDDNAMFRHPELSWPNESNNLRILDGNIGCIANGAGMAMSTMDTIVARGGRPANFLDIGGGTGEKEFVAALQTISELPGVTSVIINIFAGISRCDEIARGIIAARAQIPSLQPLFIRLEGTNRDEAVRLLDEANIAIEPSLAACIDKALGITSADGSSSSAVEDSAFSAERAKTNDQLAASESSTAEATEAVGLFSSQTLLVQGITGHHGAFHTKGMLEAGTKVVAGVTPGKAGQEIHGVPVYNSVTDAAAAHEITATVIFVPAPHAKSAMYDAIDAGIKLIVCITEGIPVHDMLAVLEKAAEAGVQIVGPNCPGLIVPGSHKLGIIAAHITLPGKTAIISRSGTLTYELSHALTQKGIGQRIILGIGGDPVSGTDFREALELCQNDPHTEQIIMVGEIGGTSEQIAADYIAEHVTKPVYGLVVGHSAPAGQQFGHAGAIVGSKSETAEAKTAYMSQKGIKMSSTLDELIETISKSQ